MPSIKQTLHALQDQYRRRRATLPWAELETEATRQGCSPADIFFDRAGRPVPGLAPVRDATTSHTPAPGLARAARQVRTPQPLPPSFDTRSRKT